MAAPVDVHVVTHTHWDREWYLPAGRFRQRLVELIDGMLETPEPAGILLDGQAVLLEDYLAVRPEQRNVLASRLRDGSIEAGPWYVLADELMPSAESLVRNLLTGRRTLRALGAEPPPVMYSPDAFGHPAALPAIAAGFGFPLIVLWRGFGGEHWPRGDTHRWRAADESEALLLHLPPSGYEQGSNLPTDDAVMRAWWERARKELGQRSRTGVLLVLNGADHHAPQPHLARALSVLERVAAPDVVRRSSLRDFAAALLARASPSSLPLVSGELRDSYGYTWTLQGTFASRAHQKRQAALVERLLAREAEPWSALAARHGSRSLAPLVDAAWRSLLRCHPHDTLCGCASDEVARAMSARLEDAETQARGVLDDATLALAGHDRAAARAAPARWRNSVLVRNPAARPRGGVTEVEVALLRRHVRVGPGSSTRNDPVVTTASFSIDNGRVPFQLLERVTRHDRIESPLHYPHDDLVDAHRGVAWLPETPAFGVAVVPVTDPVTALPAVHPTVVGRDDTLENDHLRVDVRSDGTLRLTSLVDGRVLSPLVRIEDVGDAGDLYTHSPIGPSVVESRPLAVKLLHAGPLRASLRTTWRLEVPVRSSREGRAETTAPVEIMITLTLDAGARSLRLDVRGANEADDHRLRILLATGVAGGAVHADAAFGPVRREPITVSPTALAMETPPPTAPLHRYVTVAGEHAGATLFSDGLAEYEATPTGEIALTLVRAVGELSREDLPERPGHAGWPVSTPEAQSRGPFHARLALLPHGPRTPEIVDAIEREADDILHPLRGTAFRSALARPEPRTGVALEGEGLAFSACKESEDRAWMVLRCVNLLETPARGRWRVGFSVREARLARLDETPVAPIGVEDGAIELSLPPRGVATVLVR